MVITLVCDVLGEENNGTSVATMSLVRGMRERGHEVRVVCCDVDKIGQEGFFVCPVRNFGVFNGFVRKVGVTLAKPDRAIIYSAIEGCDLVHCTLPFALTKVAIEVSRELGKPVTAGFHCQAENFSNYIRMKNFSLLNDLLYQRYYDSVYGKVDAVHYPSAFIRRTFEDKTEKTEGVVISNGVGADFFPHKVQKSERYKGKFVILSTGRYSRDKCQSILIKAVGRSSHRDEICLILAGQGVLEKKYRRLANKCKLKDYKFEFVPRASMPDLYAQADLYVHTADIELEGIAVLEAMASGKSIIVSDSDRSAPKEFARDERNLFKTNSVKSLMQKIDYFIEHPNERAECAEYYARRQVAVPVEKCMDDMERFFRGVIAQKACTPLTEYVSSQELR